MPPKTGGSATLRPKRNVKPRKTKEAKIESAVKRAINKSSQDQVDGWRASWNLLKDAKPGSADHDTADGMILTLRQTFSQIEVRAILQCVGVSRIERVDQIANRDPEEAHQKFAPARSHALSEETIAFIKEVKATWSLEDGFPCPHRRAREYFTDGVQTWKKLYDEYAETWSDLDDERRKTVKCVAYCTFTQYIHYLYPGLKLTRTETDVCDSCVRLNIVLDNPLSTEQEKEAAQQELDMHMEAARDQRRAISEFTKKYIRTLVEDPIPETIIPDYIDGEEPGDSEAALGDVLVLAEDFGQGVTLPHYGHKRPSADFFNSNLMLNFYVMADITRNEHNVFLYDERYHCKDKDALCSLRLSYHINQRLRCLAEGREPPSYFVSIRDNCVGQNKSNATLKLACFLSMSFYKKVLIVYLIPGHSHMIADRVVAWAKRSLGVENLYVPTQIVNKMNSVKGIKATFLDHSSSTRPAYTGFKAMLDKYIKDLPPLFTSNYVFEFTEGKVRTQHLVTSTQVTEVTLCGNPASTSKALQQELLGTEDLTNLNMESIRLPRRPVGQLEAKKLKSLSLKYETIPPEHLWYYPVLPENVEAEEIDAADATEVRQDLPVSRKRKAKEAPGARLPGRPRNAPVPAPATRSILQFFRIDPRPEN